MTMNHIGDPVETLHGRLLSPGSDGWAEALSGHNPAVQHAPAIVVDAANVHDLTAGVAFAHRRGMTVAVQATGHGPSVLAEGGVLIRTSRLTRIDVDPDARTVRLEPGVRWGELMSACAQYGLAPLGMASVASVGVVGYTLGGGMGPLGRLEGFAADHVRAIEIVSPDGDIHNVDADHDPDLFWAVRGGRLGFGVIASMTLDLAEAPSITTTTLTYARPEVPNALAAYAHWQADLAQETSTVASLLRFPDLPAIPEELRGQRLLRIDTIHAGGEEEGRTAVERLTATAPATTRTHITTDPAGWLHAQPPVPPVPSWARAIVLNQLDADAVRRLLTAAGPETEAPWQLLELRPMGGALGRPAMVANSVGARSEGILVNTVAAGDPRTFTALPAAHAALAKLLEDYIDHGPPINFHGLVDPAHPLATAWPSDVHTRLETIRRQRDPDERFSRSGSRLE
jgi:hypothetical protein